MANRYGPSKTACVGSRDFFDGRIDNNSTCKSEFLNYLDGQMQGVVAISTIFFVAIKRGSSIVESPKRRRRWYERHRVPSAGRLTDLVVRGEER